MGIPDSGIPDVGAGVASVAGKVAGAVVVTDDGAGVSTSSAYITQFWGRARREATVSVSGRDFELISIHVRDGEWRLQACLPLTPSGGG